MSTLSDQLAEARAAAGPDSRPEALRNLPPEALLRAMHKPLPRNWRRPMIAVAVTLLLHLVVVGTVWLRGREIEVPVNVFYVKQFPLEKGPAQDAPVPESPATPGES